MKDAMVLKARAALPENATHLLEKGYRASRVLAVNARYRFPARGLKVIGVTGTNGKTTTCNYINEVLKAGGKKTAMFTTAVIELDGVQTPNELNRTVPLTAELFDFFSKAKKAQVDWVVMEVTSHALDQHKFDGVPLEIAVITNLTQDHLDYHGTMENYAAAKARILHKKPRVAVLNRDDEWYDFFAKQAGKTLVHSFGQHEGAVLEMNELKSDMHGSRFSVIDDPVDEKIRRLDIHTSLLGQFNAYNAAAAVAVGRAANISDEKIAEGVANLKLVPGRMESIAEGQDFKVIVDYAHAEEALREVLQTVRSLGARKIGLVFGATGDRDRDKRPKMGKVAAELADRVYLTDDEPYTEDPAEIRGQVRSGIDKAGGSVKTQEFDDRRAAIAAAMKDASAGDVVLVTGMGHEKFRVIGDNHEPWDERAIVRAELKKAL